MLRSILTQNMLCRVEMGGLWHDVTASIASTVKSESMQILVKAINFTDRPLTNNTHSLLAQGHQGWYPPSTRAFPVSLPGTTRTSDVSVIAALG